MERFSQERNQWFIDEIESLNKKGVSKAEIARELGVKPQFLTPIINGTRNVSDRFLLKFCKHYGINHDDLFRVPNKSNNNISSSIPAGKPIYLYDVEAAAGHGSFSEMISQDKVIGTFNIPIFHNVDWMIYVKGASMYPKYSSGDVIACREITESRFIQWGKVYVVGTRYQGILVKRLFECQNSEYITAVSDNKEYKPFDIPKDEIFGIALVLGVVRLE